MYCAKDIAVYFLSKGPMDNMKLQKLVYFAHGWYLALFKKPLINEEVEAWEYGPVVPSLYHDFKIFGNQQISSSDIWFPKNIIDSNTQKFLDKIWGVYGKYTGVQLSNLTHIESSPWSEAVEECKKNNDGYLMKSQDIPREKIQRFFEGLLNKNNV